MSENNVESNTSNKPLDAPGAASQQSDSRRSFLKKTAVAVPLVTTLASRPVWAIGNNCSLTGTLSGNASAHNLENWCVEQLGANSPAGWANGATTWPMGVERSSTTFFDSLFEIPLGQADINITLETVLINIPAVFEEVDLEVAAAYLNLEGGLYPGLSLSLSQLRGAYSAARLDGSMALFELLRTLLQIRGAPPPMP